MRTKISMESKFSYTDEDIRVEMEKFVYHLAGRYQNDDLMFQYQEIVGELMLELVKGINYYRSKELPLEQMKAVLRRMLDNRIAELRHRHYGTHRGLSKLNISIDAEFFDEEEGGLDEVVPSSDPTPEDICISIDIVNTTRQLLSTTAQKVFDACIYGNARLSLLAVLSMIRCGENGKLNIKPWLVADALAMPEQEVSKAFKEIRNVYKEVCGGCS